MTAEQFNSIEEVLDFAIKREEEAATYYSHLAGRSDLKHLKDALLEMKVEEERHKALLEQVKSGEKILSAQKAIVDLKIADTVASIDVRGQKSLSYEDVLILAMKAEKAAYKLYYDLSRSVEDAGLKELFLQLAQEEARHKLRFEIEYDEHVLKEN